MRSNGLALRGSSKTTASHEYDADGATQNMRSTTYGHSLQELKAAYWHHEHPSDPPHHVCYALIGVSRMMLPLYADSIRLSALANGDSFE